MVFLVLSGPADFFYTHDRNKYLQKLAYGNGDSVQYQYDDLGRVLKQTYEDGDTVTYQYDNDGALAAVTDSDTGITTKYYYDFSGSTGATELRKGADIILRVSEGFDENDRLTAQNITFADDGYKILYSYNDNGTLNSIVLGQESDADTDGKAQITYSYDDFLRISGRTSGKNSQTYTYYTNSTNTQTTSQVTRLLYSGLGSTYHFDYTYDEKGNIKTYTAPGKSQITYTYDSNNQLTKAQGAKTYSYEYDEAGNIKKAVKNGTTYTYTYDNSTWGDLLTAYNGNSITYDTLGNPTKYYNDWNFTWEHGREMATATKGTTSLSFKYDANGLRTSKTVNGVEHTYYYYGGKLLRETYGTTVLDFYYDANGVPYMLDYNGTLYYYVTNAQGDVIQLVNASGTAVAKYEYDPYGATVSATSDSSTTNLITINPLRYRGYYYDSETGLYYLQSRYYDPNIGRFINADAGISAPGGALLGNNMFAYCFNNPINLSDSSGNWPGWLSGALNIVSGTLQAAAGAVLGATVGWTGVGAVAAAALVINGAATVTQGVGQIVNSVTQSNTMREDNIIRTGVQTAGYAIGGEVGYSIAGFAYDTAIMAAAAYAPVAQPHVNSTQTTFTSRGSTATRQPSNITEQLALEQVMSNPQGKQLPITMLDPRWPASEGWLKMQQVVPTNAQGNIVVHYVYNPILGIFDDFKLK